MADETPKKRGRKPGTTKKAAPKTAPKKPAVKKPAVQSTHKKTVNQPIVKKKEPVKEVKRNWFQKQWDKLMDYLSVWANFLD
jgi:hypothetical protein